MSRALSTRNMRSAAQAALSQSLSAGSNFVILLALARGGGSAVVGEFALAFVVYNAALGLQRAVVSDALLARPTEAADSGDDAEGRAATSTLLLSLALAGIVLIAGLVSPFHQLAVLAVFLPGLLLEDLFRYLLFRRGRPSSAVLVDGVWLAGSCLGFASLQSHASAHAAVLIWGCGGVAAALTGWVVTGTRFAPPLESIAWWKRHLWDSSRWLTLESILFHIEQQLLAFGLVAVAGSAAFGSWQIAQSLLGVAVFLDAGVRIVGVTHLSRHRDDRDSAIAASAASGAFTLLVTATLLLLAPTLIPIIYGSKVDIPSSTILVCGVYLAASAAATGPIAVLRAQRTERALPVGRAVSLLVFAPVAVVVAGHNFLAGLWIITAGAIAYTGVVAWAAFGRSSPVHDLRPIPEPVHEEEVGHEHVG